MREKEQTFIGECYFLFSSPPSCSLYFSPFILFSQSCNCKRMKKQNVKKNCSKWQPIIVVFPRLFFSTVMFHVEQLHTIFPLQVRTLPKKFKKYKPINSNLRIQGFRGANCMCTILFSFNLGEKLSRRNSLKIIRKE